MTEHTTTTFGLRDTETGRFVRISVDVSGDTDYAGFTFEDYGVGTMRYERATVADVLASTLEDSRKYFISNPDRPAWSGIQVDALQPVCFVKTEIFDGGDPVSGSFHTLEFDFPPRFQGDVHPFMQKGDRTDAIRTMFGPGYDADRHFLVLADVSEHPIEEGMAVAESLWSVGEAVASAPLPDDWPEASRRVFVLVCKDIQPLNLRPLDPVCTHPTL